MFTHTYIYIHVYTYVPSAFVQKILFCIVYFGECETAYPIIIAKS